MERCITQLEEGEKAGEMTGCVNCISTNTPRAGWRMLNDRADQRRAKRGAQGDKERFGAVFFLNAVRQLKNILCLVHLLPCTTINVYSKEGRPSTLLTSPVIIFSFGPRSGI